MDVFGKEIAHPSAITWEIPPMMTGPLTFPEGLVRVHQVRAAKQSPRIHTGGRKK